jgi:hypothetical protein
VCVSVGECFFFLLANLPHFFLSFFPHAVDESTNRMARK